MRLLFLFLILSACICAKGQSFIEDYPVGDLMAKYSAHNRMQEYDAGWRVQLFATTNRLQMEELLEKIQTDYPDLEYNWEHASPYYRVRVGAFKRKVEAYQLMKSLKPDFQGAFLLRDNKIKPEEFLKF